MANVGSRTAHAPQGDGADQTSTLTAEQLRAQRYQRRAMRREAGIIPPPRRRRGAGRADSPEAPGAQCVVVPSPATEIDPSQSSPRDAAWSDNGGALTAIGSQPAGTPEVVDTTVGGESAEPASPREGDVSVTVQNAAEATQLDATMTVEIASPSVVGEQGLPALSSLDAALPEPMHEDEHVSPLASAPSPTSVDVRNSLEPSSFHVSQLSPMNDISEATVSLSRVAPLASLSHDRDVPDSPSPALNPGVGPARIPVRSYFASSETSSRYRPYGPDVRISHPACEISCQGCSRLGFLCRMIWH
ncbi:hypothetical protein OH76DRAFT_1480754 [Lentinus brumalis]|uniref:Uncharacterized protein n=1 Tax=Lentinus brumalis TaxID=2498619 RepID=A0A371DHV9_9APHY|nr:hypothetical protein OH76DRAFT_1480754 [Polyporus brumalis]